MAKQRPDFRYFIDYLRKQPESAPQDMSVFKKPVQVAAGFAATVLSSPILIGTTFGLTALAQSPNPSLAAGSMLLAPVVGFLVAAGVGKKFPKQDQNALAKKRKRFDDLQVFKQLLAQNQLFNRADPAMLQLLEAAAYHHARVQTVLERSDWRGELTPLRKQIRDQAREAADEGMADIVAMAKSCVGDPNLNAKTDQVNQVVDRLLDLDIVDTLQKLRGLANPDWSAYSHRSPHTSMVFAPAREIAEKIKSLADELDRMPKAQAQSGQEVTATPGTFDNLLGDIKALREAEEELEQRF